jgi:hypothetical protein
MKTADLIATLAADAAPMPPVRVLPRMAVAAALGGAVALVILVIWLGLQPLGAAMLSGSFWMKAGYTAVLATAGLLLVARLARPGGQAGRLPLIALAAVAVMAGLALLEMARTPPGRMHDVVMGHTWAVCSLRIVTLSVPVYLGAVWALRRLAPTRLALAGAAAGLLAGSVGATVYGLYCAETAATFVLIWYTLGIASASALGAVIGQRLLRW